MTVPQTMSVTPNKSRAAVTNSDSVRENMKKAIAKLKINSTIRLNIAINSLSVFFISLSNVYLCQLGKVQLHQLH